MTRPAALLALLLFAPAVVADHGPLADRLDAAAVRDEPALARAAPPAADAEFLRRAWLDLAGTIPPAVDARAFLDDVSPHKRVRLVDALLKRVDHVRHFRDTLDVLLMERRPEKHVPRAAWQAYLQSAVEANKPWDLFVRDLLAADGADPAARPAAKFYLDRDGEPNQITRDVARLFLGQNLTCAQCHDHPLVDSYKQDDYYGLFAFFGRSYLLTDKAKNVAVFAEKPDGEATYQSVFDPDKKTRTAVLRVPGGATLTALPGAGRRARLAKQVANGENEPFRRNLANRLWAMLMGRGLVHPPDLDHPANPPSHPTLLTVLADETAVLGFDVRALLREIALSATYQRSSELPPDVKEGAPKSLAVARLKPLSPEQLAWSLMQATGLRDAERQSLGAKATDEAVVARLAGNVAPFATAFGARPGQPESFQATLDQALFLSNGALVRGWLTPRAGNLVDRLTRLGDAAVADELYLSVLTRRPSDEEWREVVATLTGRGDRTAALQELAWALLASAEFRFNH